MHERLLLAWLNACLSLAYSCTCACGLQNLGFLKIFSCYTMGHDFLKIFIYML